MASIVLSEVPLADLKSRSRDAFPGIKSSHLTEALAASLGFRTHAALLTNLGTVADANIVSLDEQLFRQRLSELGDAVTERFSFEDLIEPRWGVDRHTGRRKRINEERPDAFQTTLISTQCHNGKSPVKYNSVRAKAWRNLLVATVNEALRRKLFTFRPGDNRWSPGEHGEHGEYQFDFALPIGLPATAFIRDVGFDELSVSVTVEPTGKPGRRWNEVVGGSATASAFVERRRGAWLQSAETNFHGTRAITPRLAAMLVEPFGYGDRGAIIM